MITFVLRKTYLDALWNYCIFGKFDEHFQCIGKSRKPRCHRLKD